MKNKLIFALLVIIILTETCFAQAQYPASPSPTQLLLWRLGTHDKKHRKEFETHVIAHPELAKEMIFFQRSVLWENAAKAHAYNCLEVSSYKGLISTEEFFDIGCKLMTNYDLYHSPEYKADVLSSYMTAIANYGYPSYPLLKQVADLISLTNSMLKTGMIKNQGLLNSLTVKISNAKEIIDKKIPNFKDTAVNILQAVVNELNAQRGKGVSEDGYQILSRFCENLIAKIQFVP